MTNKTQSMLTIALTAAVSVLLVDRMIEPAQAQMCAQKFDITYAVDKAADEIVARVSDCIGRSQVSDGGWIMVPGKCRK